MVLFLSSFISLIRIKCSVISGGGQALLCLPPSRGCSASCTPLGWHVGCSAGDTDILCPRAVLQLSCPPWAHPGPSSVPQSSSSTAFAQQFLPAEPGELSGLVFWDDPIWICTQYCRCHQLTPQLRTLPGPFYTRPAALAWLSGGWVVTPAGCTQGSSGWGSIGELLSSSNSP